MQEGDQEIRGIVERLKHDVEAVRSEVAEVQSDTRASQLVSDRLEATSTAAVNNLQALSDRLAVIDQELRRGSEEKKEAASKLENNVNLIWDQIRHMESSLSQRLTLAETSQVSTLQEVDEMKEGASEVMGRVEDVKRHIAALESKLESFNTQVAAAISPLHARQVMQGR